MEEGSSALGLAGEGGRENPPPKPGESLGHRVLTHLKRRFPKRRLIRIGISVLSLFLAALFLIWLGLRGLYSLPAAQGVLPALFQGFWVTLEAVAVVIPLAFLIGFFVGWARTTQSWLLRGLGSVYVDFFRSMPPLVLIFFSFLIALLGMKSLDVNPYLIQTVSLWVGAIALSLHSAAYQAEIVRAGILSVPAGQMEAADAVGLTRWQAMFRVVLPQAFRVSLPPLGNEFSSVIKDTSLLSAIGWLDLSGAGLVLPYQAVVTFRYLFAPLLIWIEIAIFYFVVTYIINRILRTIENSFKVPGLEAAQL